jgi:hypothetical protein
MAGSKQFDVSGDPYFKERIDVPKNEELLHLEEVNHQCPLCGKFLTSKGKRKLNKNYQIAHIFPNRPTKDDMKVLKDAERLGDNCESFENKIALCKDHHWDFDQNKTVEAYNHLVEIKKSAMMNSTVKQELSIIRIERELSTVINKLVGLSYDQLKGQLNLEALEVDKKIEKEHMLLLNRVKTEVTTYYLTIQQLLKDECVAQGKKFDTLCSQIKYIYNKCSDTAKTKEEIFEGITKWMMSQTNCSEDSCHVVASYFVQNCEIYEKFTE